MGKNSGMFAFDIQVVSYISVLVLFFFLFSFPFFFL